MMQNPQVDRNAVAPANQTKADNDIATKSLPTTDRAGIFDRMVGIAVMTVALSANALPAQSPEDGPASTPPATAPAKETDKSHITQLPDRKFCLDDEGNVLIARRTQVRKIGQSVEGLPSYGEAFRALCEGVEHLKSLNGGQIPPGQDVKLRIRGQNGEDTISRSLTLNPEKLSTIAKLCPDAMNKAMADPLNRKAIDAIRAELNIQVVRTGPETLTVTFMGKDPQQKVSLSVELAPRQ